MDDDSISRWHICVFDGCLLGLNIREYFYWPGQASGLEFNLLCQNFTGIATKINE